VTLNVHHQRGLQLFNEGEFAEALAEFDAAIASDGSSEIWNDWATTHLALQNVGEAERGLRRALELNATNTTAATNLVVLLSRLGRHAEAMCNLEMAAADLPEAQRHAVALLVKRFEAARSATSNMGSEGFEQFDGSKIRAPAADRAASNAVPSSAISEPERVLLYAHRQFHTRMAELVQMAQALKSQYPQDLGVRLFSAEVLQASGQAELALAEYEGILGNVPQNLRRRVEQAIRQCKADRDYFPPDFAKRLESAEYVIGVNAPIWRSYFLREIQRGRSIARLVQDRIPLAGRRVLDVGCGYGGTLIAFAEQGANAVGVEIDEERARVGKKRLKDLGISADYREDDICAKGIEERLGTFDVIVAQDVLEHVLDLRETIRKLSVLLRPGGVIYVQVGNKYSPDQLLADHHYHLAGITLLSRAQAIEYYKAATGLEEKIYGVGYWRTEDFYRRMFARFGVRLEVLGKFSEPSHVAWYSNAIANLCERAKDEIHPKLRPELQERIRRRMMVVARYYAQAARMIAQSGSNPRSAALLSDCLVKRLCIPVWQFIGARSASLKQT
jgi:2-polyprenyl-3-methyl-5-hydroxy-6-metoxy-1,4-benzoquinol methylase